MFFVLNRGLKWSKAIRKTASGDQTITPCISDALIVPDFYNGDLWTFHAIDSLQDEFVIEIEYAGHIHPRIKESTMPTMGYIKRDFVELACYSAWYPVPMNIETNMSFEISIESPKDWKWMVNGVLQKVEQGGNSSVWKWKQNSFVNDITMIGLPERDAFSSDESSFWGPKSIVASQRILDKDIKELEKRLIDWLGKHGKSTSIKFVVTPRTEGGAYTRSGMIVVGGGYSTDPGLRRQVLQAMCHEVCHDWFYKASVRSYDNWIDEALAEYCSIMVTEDLLDNGFLDWRTKITLEKLENQGEIPSIRSLTRDSNTAYAAYYFRGFLLLNEIAKHFGRDKVNSLIGEFAQFCIEQKSVSTDNFQELLERRLGKQSRELVDRWLDYEGKGIPGN